MKRTTSCQGSRARQKGQRGNAVLEFGLAAVVFLSLLFASADFGYTVWVRAMLRHAAREGARFATTGRTLDGMSQDASIREMVRRNSMGTVSQRQLDLVRIKYFTPEGNATHANDPGNLVSVKIGGYSHTPIGAILRSNHPLIMSAESIDVVEPYSGKPPAR